MRVRLFQFVLLELQARLRFLQGAALLFQLHVGRAQLLALRLKLLRLTLRFFEQFLQAEAVLRRSHRHPDGLRNAFEQFRVRGACLLDESQFQNRVDGAIHLHRRDQKMPWPALSQTRTEIQITFRHVMNEESASILDSLSKKPVSRPEAVRRPSARGLGIGAATAEGGPVIHEERTGLSVKILPQKTQDVCPKLLKPQFTTHFFVQPGLTRLKPLLPSDGQLTANEQVAGAGHDPDGENVEATVDAGELRTYSNGIWIYCEVDGHQN